MHDCLELEASITHDDDALKWSFHIQCELKRGMLQPKQYFREKLWINTSTGFQLQNGSQPYLYCSMHQFTEGGRTLTTGISLVLMCNS